MLNWPEGTLLSAYASGHGHATILSPERAYAGMPEDARIAAAVVDSALRERWDWIESVLNCILGNEEPKTSDWATEFLEARGLKSIDDVYEAARVSKAQQWAWELHMMHHPDREIGVFMGTSAHAARLQIWRTREKLERLFSERKAMLEVECECGEIIPLPGYDGDVDNLKVTHVAKEGAIGHLIEELDGSQHIAS